MKQLKYRTSAFLLASRLDPSTIERRFLENPLRPSDELNFVSKVNVKLAAIQMELRPYRNLAELVEHLKQLVDDARKQGAQLISFPEYVGLLPLMLSPTLCELAEDLLDAAEENDSNTIQEILGFFDEYLSKPLFTAYYNFFALLANQSRLYIHAGSTLLMQNGKLVERCFLFSPDGEVILEQDKLFPSRLEEKLGISSTEHLELTDTALGRIAILPGQDSFYYETAKIAHELGAQLLLCPLRPTYQYNEMALRCGPWMRCQEQPLYALSSHFVGRLGGDTLRGKAAIYGPYEAVKASYGGIVAQCNSDKETVLVSRVDMECLPLLADPYSIDENEMISPVISQAYSSFPQPLERLTPLEQE